MYLALPVAVFQDIDIVPQQQKRDRLEFNLALKEKEMHADLKWILADPEQDLMGMFRMQVDE